MRDRVKADDGKCLFLFSSSPLQVFAHKKKKKFSYSQQTKGRAERGLNKLSTGETATS